jgi:tRNA pseudouridine55 synthase
MGKRDEAPSGLILLHKRVGLTSFDSLRDIKRLLGSGKAGHTGTLDKFAEGLLLVLTGRALRLSKWFTHCDKQYEGTIRFGLETDTLDPEGSVIAEAPLPSCEAVEQALFRFRGDVEQAPPAYSALHIDGERASVLARRGEAPDMQKRPVRIHRLELISWEPPLARIFVHCSSGTYIRSLARDIALATGSRGHLVSLLRTRVAGFRLEDAVSVKREEGTGNSGIDARKQRELPVRTDNEQQLPVPSPQSPVPFLRLIDKTIFATLDIPCVDVSSEDARKIMQGKPLAQVLKNAPPAASCGENAVAAVFCDDTFLAMIEFTDRWNYGYVYARD